MLMFEITTNVFVFAAIALVAAFAGFIVRAGQLSRSRLRVMTLEREIIINHAEILELQKDFIALELKIYSASEVIKMNNVPATAGDEKLPDISLRKKLLAKENAPEKSETMTVVYNNLLSKQA